MPPSGFEPLTSCMFFRRSATELRGDLIYEKIDLPSDLNGPNNHHIQRPDPHLRLYRSICACSFFSFRFLRSNSFIPRGVNRIIGALVISMDRTSQNLDSPFLQILLLGFNILNIFIPPFVWHKVRIVNSIMNTIKQTSRCQYLSE